MGRKPSKIVDMAELELMMGHGTFDSFLRAMDEAAGRTLNKRSMRVYWSYWLRYGNDWRTAMRERRPLDPEKIDQWKREQAAKAVKRRKWEMKIRAARP